MSRFLASGAICRAKLPRDLLGGDLAAARPLGVGEPEDVAEAVVADVPGLGEARLDLAAGVEANQPLGGAGEQQGIGGAGGRFRRVGGAGRLADHQHFERPGGLPAAAGAAQGERGAEREAERAAEGKRPHERQL